MKKTLYMLAGCLLAMNGAMAADLASIERGGAKSWFCTGCHGYNGMGTHSLAGLAGRDAETMQAQLFKYKKERRSIMGSLLDKYSEDDLTDLANYFASLKATDNGMASFERDITPILEWRCQSCHSEKGEGASKSGLNLASYQGLMQGTHQGGDLINPGSAASSTFFVMLTRKDHLRMPYGAPPLSDDELRVVKAWIEQGAKDN